jgi:hypothetical protein
MHVCGDRVALEHLAHMTPCMYVCMYVCERSVSEASYTYIHTYIHAYIHTIVIQEVERSVSVAFCAYSLRLMGTSHEGFDWLRKYAMYDALCVYVYDVCMYVCMCACMYVWELDMKALFDRENMRRKMPCACMYVFLCIYVCMYTNMYVCMYTCMGTSHAGFVWLGKYAT